MSEEQLSALLAKLKEDAGLLEKLKGAADFDAIAAAAKEAGLELSKDDWLRYQENQAFDLNDDELERVSGGQQPVKSDSLPGYEYCNPLYTTGENKLCKNRT